MSTSRKLTKQPRFRDIDAWGALKRRDLEYAINLLVSGDWTIDGVFKDDWSSLDALTSAPVRTHVATEKLGGSFRTIKSEHEGIQDEPCWKLGGYSMYHASQPGKLLGANNDDDYIEALDQSNVGDLMFVFGFVYHEYPPQTENGGVDLSALQKSICGDMIRPLRMESVGLSCGLNPKHKVNNQNLLSLSVAYNGITREFNLDDIFVASQRNPAARTTYRMQCKSIPFTFNHIDISTPKIEETKWSGILDRHQSAAELKLANLFVVGNAFYSMNDQTEADRLMLVNNDNEKLRSLLQHHPEHEVFLKRGNKAKIDHQHEVSTTKGAKRKERCTPIESHTGV
ncbi:hypothetical protein FOC4_g10007666 [Fusarium odoratissimum]|uniref:Uncharacterized protein n=1 Tax=Fusarium oxysporum f. sp. cubense (strain race 4) TaxID=2502994 RepID=N1RG27_FUSC4|nr:hypothetical protein FOC4_g10007666 [Fusarium odoratissimum]